MTTDRMTRKFDRAQNAARRRLQARGRLGRKNDNGSYSMAAERSGFLYVTLTSDGAQTVDIALVSGVPRIYNLPVTLERIGGHLVVTGLDYEGGVLEAFLAGGVAFAPPHTHREGSGLVYEMETKYIDAGRVLWSSGTTVRIRPFFYHWQGVEKYYAGGTLNLSGSLPGTAAKWAWVEVCINPATNAAVAVTGAEYAAQVDLLDSLIANIDTLFYIPLAAVQCQNGDTSLSAISRYRDARRWLGNGGPRTMSVNTTAVGNVGSGEDDLLTYSVPAATLAKNGDSLWFEAAGSLANNANSKNVRVRFGTSGTNLILAFTATDADKKWLLRGRIFRTGATAQQSHCVFQHATATQTENASATDQTLSGAVTLRITGEGVATDDIRCHSLIVGIDPYDG